ncbi:MAG TPA: endonuclease/exonuclease/phosphatase family protein [Longimicrobiaceae bacterium]|nr:endonuclease/exonuclease/phosphatase family protein [Longimicrobiaceae bacterium]
MMRGGEEARLRVLVYNIHAGKDAAGMHNLARVAELVRDSRADLVLLQEVDRGTERSGREDQLAEISRLTGLGGAFGRTLYYQGGEYGIAVLAGWPVLTDSLHPLPVEPAQARAGGSYEPRGAQHVTIASPRGTIHLLNSHLDASRDDSYRLQEVGTIRALADSLRRRGGLVLVGGDFNAEPGSRVVEQMTAGGWRDAWATCGAGPGFTFPADEPVKRIDYLFIPPSVRCDSAAVIDSHASDHRPVLFILAAPQQQSRSFSSRVR